MLKIFSQWTRVKNISQNLQTAVSYLGSPCFMYDYFLLYLLLYTLFADINKQDFLALLICLYMASLEPGATLLFIMPWSHLHIKPVRATLGNFSWNGVGCVGSRGRYDVYQAIIGFTWCLLKDMVTTQIFLFLPHRTCHCHVPLNFLEIAINGFYEMALSEGMTTT